MNDTTPDTVDITPAGLSPEHPNAQANADAAQQASIVLRDVIPARKVALFDTIVQDFSITPLILRNLLYQRAWRLHVALNLESNFNDTPTPQVHQQITEEIEPYVAELASIHKDQNAAGEQLVAALGGRL